MMTFCIIYYNNILYCYVAEIGESQPLFGSKFYTIILQPNRYTDRQTDILLTEIKVITDLFVIVIREIYVHVYTRMLVC